MEQSNSLDPQVFCFFPVTLQRANPMTEHLKYDIGQNDLRPIAHYLNTEVDHQNSLNAMLLRGFR